MNKFCGMIEATGEAVPTPEGKIGYCRLTENQAPLALENGIWTCEADSDSMNK